jgi:hypothetical protein
MKDVDFRYVFLGIETPENDTLKLIQKSGICMAMISLLYALPNTQLTRRLVSEGGLFLLA